MCAPLCGAQAQFAPTGTDFEHPAARADAGRVQQSVDLAPLRGRPGRRGMPAARRTARSSMSLSRRGIRRTARSTGRSARRRCAGRALGCCAVMRGCRTTASGRNRCSAGGISSTRRLANSVSTPDQVVGVPVAGHVGLAEADQAVAADPAHERVRPVHDHRGQCRIGGADHRTVGVHHPNRQPRRRTTKQPVGDRGRQRCSAGRQARCATAGHRSESIVVVMVPPRSMLTVGRPSPSQRFRCAARRGRGAATA